MNRRALPRSLLLMLTAGVALPAHADVGVPMLAGPGAISTVMVLAGASKSVVTTVGVYVAIALTAFLTYVTLAAAPRVEQKLGQTGMRILTRLMGLVLCAIAVQFIIDGIKMAGL